MLTLWRTTFPLIAISLVATCVYGKTPARVAFKDMSAVLPSVAVYGEYGALWGDFNNDDRIDLIYMRHGAGPLMLAQTGDHQFVDVTGNSGIKTSKWEYKQQEDRHGASCADFDNDGNIDLFISHGAKEGKTLGVKFDELLQGRGDFTFTDITRSAGTMNHFGRARSSVWFDYNKDGLLDLYLLNSESNNVMYKNNGDGTFTDVTGKVGLSFPAVQAAPADFDQDGDIDVLAGWPLKLYRNNGAGQFIELTRAEFAFRGRPSFGMSWGDADNDGDLDIFVSRVNTGSLLLVNDAGRFRSVESEAFALPAGTTSTGVAWGDVDNDGLLDVVNVRSDGYHVLLNDGELAFSSVKLDAPAPDIHMQNGDAALADYNTDGLPDIATDDLGGYMLLKNASAPANNWLQLQFHGTENNRMGFGNKVWVSSRGKLLAYREYTGSAGNLRSSSCSPLQIGLAGHSEVDIRVQWLNGFETVLHNVTTNQVLTLADTDAASAPGPGAGTASTAAPAHGSDPD